MTKKTNQKSLARPDDEAALQEWVEIAHRRSTAKRRKYTSKVWLTRTIVVVVALGLWEWGGQSGFLNKFFFSSPSDIGSHLWKWSFVSGELWRHVGVTLYESGIGFVFGGVAGVVLGIFFGLMPFASKVFDPLILALYSLPKIALMPLFIIWFGLGPTSKIVMAGITVFFLVFFNTVHGVRGVNVELINVLRVMGAKKSDILTKTILPSSLSEIFVGLKISLPYALVGAVAGEMMA